MGLDLLRVKKSQIIKSMFWWTVSILLMLFVAYATYVLFFGLDKEENTRLSDFIKDAPGKKITS